VATSNPLRRRSAHRRKEHLPCVRGGVCASPPEDCGGPKAYVENIDDHRWNPLLDELQMIADAVGRVLDSQGHERIRDVLGDVDALEEAVDRLETNDSDLVVLIDESSIAGSSSMRKAMKNGPGSRGRRR
jgi:hypothetical protein